jgi:multidrug efflux pump subunit AcrA (membrane-fusion protein)
MKASNSSSLLINAQIQGWIVVLLGFIGFIAWAASYPIDQGIAGSGFLISKAERIQVLAPSTGLVSSIGKRAGDSVLAGDVLLEFDAKPQQANERSVQESIRGIEISNISLRSALAARNAQVAALQTQYNSSLKLVDAGFASASALATIQTQLSLAQSEALELKSRIEQNDYRLRELRERQSSMRHEMALLKIHAPASGKVMNMAVKSAGVNITAGSQIMEIVPDGERLLIDVRIPVDYATRAHAGMAVDVMFPTLPGSSTVRIKGKLDYLSADRLTDTRTNQIYLEGRVSLEDQSQIEALNLRAGLPATVLLNTGPRTLLSYIIRPLTERMAKGMQ